MRTTLPALELAIDGYCELLTMIHGRGDAAQAEPEVAALPMTPSLFKAVFCGKRK